MSTKSDKPDSAAVGSGTATDSTVGWTVGGIAGTAGFPTGGSRSTGEGKREIGEDFSADWPGVEGGKNKMAQVQIAIHGPRRLIPTSLVNLASMASPATAPIDADGAIGTPSQRDLAIRWSGFQKRHREESRGSNRDSLARQAAIRQGHGILDFRARILDRKTFDRAFSIQNPSSKIQNAMP
jgi:hypothetical protein